MRVMLLVLALLGMTLGMTTGCKEKAPEGTTSGSVTYKGKPLSIGVVVFCSQDAMHRAGGNLDANGKFTLTGPLPVGEYKVGFCEPFFDNPSASRPRELTSPLPKKYLDYESSGVTFTVNEGSNTADFNL